MSEARTSRVGRPSPPSVLRITVASTLEDEGEVDDDVESDDGDEVEVDGMVVGWVETEAVEDAEAAAGST
jgi:hypothetical protein